MNAETKDAGSSPVERGVRPGAQWDGVPLGGEGALWLAGDPARRIAALEAEAAALRKDAERYRWLRDRCAWTMCGAPGMVRLAHRLPINYQSATADADEMDEVVDLAMAAGAA